MVPIGNTEPNAKKIFKIGSQLAKKSGNIDTKNQSNREPPPFLKSVKNRVKVALSTANPASNSQNNSAPEVRDCGY